MPAANKDIVVIGGSSGSSSVLKKILADLPDDLPASVLVTTHLASSSTGSLGAMLAERSNLPVTQAADQQAIEHGHVYLAPPDRHLLLMDGVIRLGDGPRENMARPAVDALFRSAALSFGPRVTGVVLSGLLNDGAAGLTAIKSCGGTAVVQNPLDRSSRSTSPCATSPATTSTTTSAAPSSAGSSAGCRSCRSTRQGAE